MDKQIFEILISTGRPTDDLRHWSRTKLSLFLEKATHSVVRCEAGRFSYKLFVVALPLGLRGITALGCGSSHWNAFSKSHIPDTRERQLRID